MSSQFQKLNETNSLTEAYVVINTGFVTDFTIGNIYTANIFLINDNEKIVKIANNKNILKIFSYEEYEKNFKLVN